MSQKKSFLLNGQRYYITGNLTLFDLINYFNYSDSLLVLEHNNLIYDKKKWKNI